MISTGNKAAIPLQAGDSRSDSVSLRKISEQNTSETSSKNVSSHSLTQTAPKQRLNSQMSASKTKSKASTSLMEETIRTTPHEPDNSAAPMNYLSDSSSDDSSSPRSLPRQPLEENHSRRKQAPVTEEMEFNVHDSWKPKHPKSLFKGDDLNKVLYHDMYDKDWAVDVKIIENVGEFGSRISETGNVYMFTAHHLVPENYCRIECSSSSDDEELVRKRRNKKISKKSKHAPGLISSSSDEAEFVRNHKEFHQQVVYT